ncbi:hypothetical protein AN396_09275 [Candidatus Epulonipiscium fishelsonii]|uniref:Uncharacterized protein n=1 Tax=Candidatus Epulonipiscium fishelsonii TaxID=77094 RepID=A0ACC8X9L2_9FIRM|nr:hypothetical protein AN396_09275 [Epulopiscium sp. SCG-B11WGA-EpuloA1]
MPNKLLAIQNSVNSYFLLENKKFGIKKAYSFKNIEKLSYVITDNKLSEELVDLYKTKYKLLVATAQ